jgi:hypothetical protein
MFCSESDMLLRVPKKAPILIPSAFPLRPRFECVTRSNEKGAPFFLCYLFTLIASASSLSVQAQRVAHDYVIFNLLQPGLDRVIVLLVATPNGVVVYLIGCRIIERSYYCA